MSNPTIANIKEKRPSKNTAPEWLATDIATPRIPKLALATIEMMIERLSIACDDIFFVFRFAFGLHDSTKLGRRRIGSISEWRNK